MMRLRRTSVTAALSLLLGPRRPTPSTRGCCETVLIPHQKEHRRNRFCVIGYG